jgi:hypothetical protein
VHRWIVDETWRRFSRQTSVASGQFLPNGRIGDTLGVYLAHHRAGNE